MKTFAALVLALTLVFALTACGGNSKKVELTVFAAASMQETLTEIGENYRADHQNVNLVFNFDSSGTLKTQIEEGADCDIFISAGQKQMDQLDASASEDVNTEGLDFVLEVTRFDLLENKVALAVPEGNPAGIHSFGDLKTALEAAVGRLGGRITDVAELAGEEEETEDGYLVYCLSAKSTYDLDSRDISEERVKEIMSLVNVE